MVSENDCIECPEGRYCIDGINKDACDPGYFCDFGAVSATDTDKICPAGHYCPAGTGLPIRCPEGYYNPNEGGQSKNDCYPCEAGYYCIENDSVSRICPKGHFCSTVTTDPTPCRPGQYQPEKGMSLS